jgi:hypothetical protein
LLRSGGSRRHCDDRGCSCSTTAWRPPLHRRANSVHPFPYSCAPTSTISRATSRMGRRLRGGARRCDDRLALEWFVVRQGDTPWLPWILAGVVFVFFCQRGLEHRKPRHRQTRIYELTPVQTSLEESPLRGPVHCRQHLRLRHRPRSRPMSGGPTISHSLLQKPFLRKLKIFGVAAAEFSACATQSPANKRPSKFPFSVARPP